MLHPRSAYRLAALAFAVFTFSALLIALAPDAIANGIPTPSLGSRFSVPGAASERTGNHEGVPGNHEGVPLQAPLANCTPNVVNFDIVYVRAPRFGDNENSLWADTVRPLSLDPGAELRLLHPNCTEEKLFPNAEHQGMVDATIGNGSVTDPNVSFDGKWVVFAYYHDLTDQNEQRCAANVPGGCLSYRGADIYRMNLETREVARLTRQEFTPNTGNSANFDCSQQYTNCPRVGVFNVNPAFVATSDVTKPGVAFVSSRNNFLPVNAFNGGERALQLFVMDWDGKNVNQIGYLNQSEALHPFQLLDGRLMFTSWENQGARDARQFNLWVIRPDGTQWDSVSGFGENATAHHFMTQMPDEDIVVVRYYNLNNNGFGDLARYPLNPAGVDLGGINQANTYMPFQRKEQVNLTNWTDSEYSLAGDFPAPCAVGNNIYNDIGADCPGGNATRVGKVTQPAVTPGGGLLLIYTPGPANHNGIFVGNGRALPFYDGGIYFMNAAKAADGTALPSNLQKILNDPNYNEQWSRPVVPYAQIFAGRAQPNVLPNFQNVNNDGLPDNTPFGLIGSSSLIWRDTNPRLGPPWAPDPDPFNASHDALSAWQHQGADAGIYTDNDIYAVRILGLLPQTDRSYPNNGRAFSNVGDERLRILGELPVRHEGVIDSNGYTDTSFLARIPADVPFTFQTLDRNGMVLNMAQTWHQLRPGEVRNTCGGCHAHAKEPQSFEGTWASTNPFTDMALQTQLLAVSQLNGSPAITTLSETQTTVEYLQDIQPILASKCADCHLNDTDDGALNLHADGSPIDGFPGTYYRLVRDYEADYGLGTPSGTFENFLPPTLTRYLRAFQARDSMLIWKIFNARLDGRQNNTRDGDLDFTPSAAHANLMTWAEKMKFVRWVDLGAPIDLSNRGAWGWFEDDLRPTLWASPTGAQANASRNQVTVSAYDLESGLKNNSLRVTFNIPINGHAAGYNFAQGINPANGATVNVPLGASVNLAVSNAVMTVQIQDNAGQLTEIVRSFSASGNTPTPTRTPTATPTGTRPTPTATATATNTPPGCGGLAVPVRSAPPNKATLKKRRVRLDWNDVLCSTRYNVVVRQGGKKGAQVLARDDVADSFVKTPKLARGSRYVWRARTCGGNLCTGWTKWWKFSIE